MYICYISGYIPRDCLSFSGQVVIIRYENFKKTPRYNQAFPQLTLITKMFVTIVLDKMGASALLVLLHTAAYLVQRTKLNHCEGFDTPCVFLLLNGPGILVHHGGTGTARARDEVRDSSTTSNCT